MPISPKDSFSFFRAWKRSTISPAKSSRTLLTRTSCFVALVVFVHQGLELLGEVDALDLVDLLEVLDGAFEELLEELDLGVGEFDLLDLGEVVVAEDVDLGGAVFAEFEDLFDAVAGRASAIISRTLAFIWALSGASPLVSLATMERTAR
jgi:hypothetical protein